MHYKCRDRSKWTDFHANCNIVYRCIYVIICYYGALCNIMQVDKKSNEIIDGQPSSLIQNV
jgi:hypothetical protein